MKSIHFPSTRYRSLAAGFVGALAMAGGLAAAVADSDRATSSIADPPMVIPYEGVLMKDGKPFQGTAAMVFLLHSGPLCNDCVVWTESRTVNVVDGAFAVDLGAVSPLTNVVLDANRVYLSTVAEGAALSGRQALEPVAFAHWSANADDLNVTRLDPLPGASSVDVDARLALFPIPDPIAADTYDVRVTLGDQLGPEPNGETFYATTSKFSFQPTFTDLRIRIQPENLDGELVFFGPLYIGGTTFAVRTYLDTNLNGNTITTDKLTLNTTAQVTGGSTMVSAQLATPLSPAGIEEQGARCPGGTFAEGVLRGVRVNHLGSGIVTLEVNCAN